MTPEQEILADHIERSAALEEQIQRTRRELASLLPLTVHPDTLQREQALLVWAFCKQFELFHDQVARKLLRSVAAVAGVGLRTREVLPLLEWAERIRLLEYEQWRDIGELRNKLVHEYVTNLDDFGPLVTQADGACIELIALRGRVLHYVGSHQLLGANNG